MSQEALEQFMTQVEGSADLQAQIGEEIEADALVALGAAHGCEFTVDDVRAGGTAESAGELSDEQLEPVAGGVLGDGSGRFLRGSDRPGYKDYDYCHAQGFKVSFSRSRYNPDTCNGNT